MSLAWAVVAVLVLVALHRIARALERAREPPLMPSDEADLRWTGEDTPAQATPLDPTAIDDNGAGVRELLRRLGK